MDEKVILEQLKALKGITVRTGAIHDAQLFQLEMWPLMLFNGLSSTISVDTEKRIVIFDIISDKQLKKSTFEERKNILTEWTRNILWDNTGVDIKIKVIKNERKKRKKQTIRIKRSRKGN